MSSVVMGDATKGNGRKRGKARNCNAEHDLAAQFGSVQGGLHPPCLMATKITIWLLKGQESDVMKNILEQALDRYKDFHTKNHTPHLRN